MPTHGAALSVAVSVLAAAATSAQEEDCAAADGSPVAMRKAIKQVLPAAPKHWVGDGFHVHP